MDIKNMEKYKDFKYVKYLDIFGIPDWCVAEQLFKDAITNLYEGLILRDLTSKFDPGYSNHHTSNAMKYKLRFDTEGVVTGYNFGKGKAANQLATWTIIITRESVANADERVRDKLTVGLEFKATPKADDEQKKKWYNELQEGMFETKYKGQKCTFDFFEVSDQGIPTQPYFIAFRDYEAPQYQMSAVFDEI
jgi:ATP-dependent DNA ligase